MWKILCAGSAGRQLKLRNTSSSIVLPCAEEEARIWKLSRRREDSMADQQSVRSMTIADLESAIILKFSCPTCDKYIYPPIGQCLRGHTFCPKCFNRMNRCPFCLQKSPNPDVSSWKN
nr:unnamed protein product [Callosobruchus chinensis]